MSSPTTLRHIVNKLHSTRDTAVHDYKNVFKKEVRWVRSVSHVDLSDCRVLIIGCGYNYPDPLLWSSVCAYAIGIDLRKSFWKSGWLSLFAEYMSGEPNSISACARTIMRRVACNAYYDRLRGVSGLDIDEMSQELITYNGQNLPFADESFDVILSNAVLEHVYDLEQLSGEMARVTRKGGICYHLWHNYFSQSGAHVPEEMARANPWGHLRGDEKVGNWLLLSGTYLNKRLPSDIAHVLSTDFHEVAIHRLDKDHNVHGIDTPYECEGEHELSPELETEIRAYPREILLTRAYAFLGRKGVTPPSI